MSNGRIKAIQANTDALDAILAELKKQTCIQEKIGNSKGNNHELPQGDFYKKTLDELGEVKKELGEIKSLLKK